jgi:hypothetical protein
VRQHLEGRGARNCLRVNVHSHHQPVNHKPLMTDSDSYLCGGS